MSQKDWRNRIVGSGVKPASQFLANPKNWRMHPKSQQAALRGSLNEVGFIAPVIENIRTGYLVDGHERIWEAMANNDCEVPFVQIDVDEAEEDLILATLDPIGAMATADKEKLDELLQNIQTGEAGLQEMLAELAAKSGLDYGGDKPDDTEEKPEINDSIWPSDNQYGIPLLDLEMQANSLVAPFLTWGSVSRKSRINGTWHFYTQDYRYEELWKNPANVILTDAKCCVEPNFSCYSQMPVAVGLWNIYRKRWIARQWQSYGIKIFADLNVAEPFYELNMLGIPQGWKAWATRGYNERIALTEKEFEMACERAGTKSILFLVYGGGKLVKELCLSRGWLWFNEQEEIAKEKNHG